MKITAVVKGSPAEIAGIRPGDEVTAVNGGSARDEIDLMYYGSGETTTFTVRRGSKEFTRTFDGAEDHGMEFEPMKFMSCGNNCLFCFIDQNPRGMRKAVYFKDEDYRLSFLHGAYVTLTSLKEHHLGRIVEQHLSPLYVSVHATDPIVRKKLLGLSGDDGLMEKIDHLVGEGIVLHCQIVICPGINDGDVLERSIRDLRERYPEIRSVAIVPVGLTKYRDDLFPLKGIDSVDATQTIVLVDGFHEKYLGEDGYGFVYCSDEWYIRAGHEIPGTIYYDDFPQIENGVGMIRDFMESVSGLEHRLGMTEPRPGNYVLVTGVSMSPYIEDLSLCLNKVPGIQARTVTVRNGFYGDSVTVSGLLTGRDIINALRDTGHEETVVLPPNCLNADGVFLDDTTPENIADTYGIEVIQGTYNPLDVFFQEDTRLTIDT
ncbi:DUF512 domain-containing protein [bacterium]|nr:DUF512 domain-containing protein [bacterium]